MKPMVYLLVIGGILFGLQASVQAQGRGKGSKGKSDTVVATSRDGVHGEVHIGFSSHETQIIRQHYAPQYRNLPPGLQKKLARTGQLPPGWQKKMQPFPVVLERQLPTLPVGYQRGVIDGHAVIYKPGTSIVIDATVLF